MILYVSVQYPVQPVDITGIVFPYDAAEPLFEQFEFVYSMRSFFCHKSDALFGEGDRCIVLVIRNTRNSLNIFSLFFWK